MAGFHQTDTETALKKCFDGRLVRRCDSAATNHSSFSIYFRQLAGAWCIAPNEFYSKGLGGRRNFPKPVESRKNRELVGGWIPGCAGFGLGENVGQADNMQKNRMFEENTALSGDCIGRRAIFTQPPGFLKPSAAVHTRSATRRWNRRRVACCARTWRAP